MNFIKHSNLEGQHAFLGASNYHWINYDEDKLVTVYRNALAKERGTLYHALAAQLIRLHQRLPRTHQTLNMYVNDAIGYDMTPEQILYYSDNCFGTADAISFKPKTKVLRIHDLKTGAVRAHPEQLMVYSALFCLEYGQHPEKIDILLRIYQNDEIYDYNPDPKEIRLIMDKIVSFDKIITTIKSEED